VDWEQAVEWTEMSLEDFRVQQPRRPVAFRLKIRGSDYYNHGFSDDRKWLAAELYLPFPDRRKETVFYGYIERGSQAWKDLAIYTEPGNNGSVIINIRYPEKLDSPEQVIIDSMVLNSWFYTEEPKKSASAH
jgi:hypothetical protein